MAMSRKDYITLAATARAERGAHFAKEYTSMTAWEKGTYDAWNTYTLALAITLREGNPGRFDSARFLKACGVGE